MSRFYVGQEVITLCDKRPNGSMELKKGEIVTVTRLGSCPHCQFTLINVNNRPCKNNSPMGLCKCGSAIPTYGFGWAGPETFAPLQTASEESDMEQSIKEALEKELFEA